MLESGGARIGVVGLTTPTTAALLLARADAALPDPLEAMDRAVFALRRQGMGTVVALSHLGLPEDRRLAAEVEGMDAIVGGHTHLLLANGRARRGRAAPAGPGAGKDRDVRIVEAMCHGRYLGRLDLDLAADGRVAAHGGAERPVDASVPEDPAVAAIVAEYAAPLEEMRRPPRGRGPVPSPTPPAGTRNAPSATSSPRPSWARCRAPSGGDERRRLPRAPSAGPVTFGDVPRWCPTRTPWRP